MNKTELRLSGWLLAAGLMMTGGIAQATPITFDFGAVGAVSGNEQANPAENDATPIGLRFDGTNSVYTDGFSGSGLQVIATGQNQSTPEASGAPFAYLDGLSGGRQAGLGVCQGLSGTQCGPNSDDNVTGNNSFYEQLTLTFNSPVSLSGLTFKGENHFGVGSSELASTETFLLNGSRTTFGAAEGLSGLMGTSFTFGFDPNDDNEGSPEQFYLGALTAETVSVPAPAGVGFVGMLLIALGLFIRRRQSRVSSNLVA